MEASDDVWRQVLSTEPTPVVEDNTINNYGQMEFAELWKVATAGVYKRWFKDPAVVKGFKSTLRFIHEAGRHSVYDFCPRPEHIFEPLKWLRPYEDGSNSALPVVKVVILGQDPYPRLEDAYGIAFHSLNWKCPYSARNINGNLIYYEHIDERFWNCSDYRPWLAQGVLLINPIFTCVANNEKGPGSHGTEWQGKVDPLFRMITPNSVGLFFGGVARQQLKMLPCKYKILHCHPVSRTGQFNEKDVFGEANKALAEMKLTPINWTPGSKYRVAPRQ